jgi:MFS family permease
LSVLGALFFGYLARWIGAKRAILLSLVIWTGVAIYAFSPLLETGRQFFLLGAVIALVLGGSQALSRSLFSQMIPQGQETEYFSLYEISERGTSVRSLFLAWQSIYRQLPRGVLAVGIFFIAGLILLPLVDVRRAILEAGNRCPISLFLPLFPPLAQCPVLHQDDVNAVYEFVQAAFCADDGGYPNQPGDGVALSIPPCDRPPLRNGLMQVRSMRQR